MEKDMETNIDLLLHKFKYLIDIETETNCYIWKGTIATHNSPVIKIRKKMYSVNRLVYEYIYQQALGSSHIFKSCNNSLCVNYEHFYVKPKSKEFTLFKKIFKDIDLTPEQSRLLNRIAKKCITSTENTCISWTGRTDHKGYPIINYNLKVHRVQHLMFNLYHETTIARHLSTSCKNKICLNVDHMY